MTDTTVSKEVSSILPLKKGYTKIMQKEKLQKFYIFVKKRKN